MRKRKLIQYITVLSVVAMMLATWDGAMRGPTAATARSTRGSITTSPRSAAGPAIHTITTNLADYPNSQVPRYEKLEVTFQVETVAQNPDLPYDATSPPGIEPGIGITVNALFTPDNWQTIYTQPAFYYQDFEHEVKSGKEWIHPTDNFSWKVRFAPDQTGGWQFKLMAQDASGTTETDPQTFTVVPSDNKGFLQVSQKDPRYFEFEDGTYFPALGYNMNYDHVGWVNPVLDNEENFQEMSQNGIQLVRIWLSEWAIYGSWWNPWSAQNPNLHNRYLGHTGITFEEAYPGSEVSMKINWDYSPCMFIGVWKAPPAVRRNTNYRVRIRYKTKEIAGPRIPGNPFGFVAKTGGWLWGDGNYCYDPGTGTPVTPYQDQDTTDWQILEGTLNSGNRDFLPNFFLVLENVSSGTVYVDYVWIQEELGNGEYGPNIVSKPWMAHHLYMEQRNSYAFDKVLELAKQHDIYIRPVIHEKNEWIFNRIDYEGNSIPDDPRCWDQDHSNDPEECPDNKWFYGNRRQMTKVRWLQQAWWRYLQARWGYSTNIHSWELLNEGDPWNELHYTLADEFGKYMHQFKADDHMVSTSNWHSFPKDNFWANSQYPNVDFADIHLYVQEGDPNFSDTALATQSLSMQYGARRPGGAGKPIMRGEIGFIDTNWRPNDYFKNDTDAVWLHNFVWGGINSGGLIESYWHENTHIYSKKRDGTYNFDHRDQYGVYYNFIKDIPLNSGHYQDAEALVSNDNLRAWGQKDPVNGRAHLWIQNKNHTWKNVVDGVSIPPVSGTVELSGFQPGASYTIEWWDTYQPSQIIRTDTAVAQADGSITLSVENLASDIAVKIAGPPAPNQAPVVDAGPDQTVALLTSATLTGSVTDDGLPNPPGTVTTTWAQVSGPGTVTFANASAPDTTASLSAAGTYTLRLTADDGAISASDDVTVTVNSEPNAPSSTLDWPQYQHDPARTGYNPDEVPSHQFNEVWSKRFVGDGISSTAQPIIMGNTAFIGTEKGWIYALDLATGTELWTKQLDGAITHTPAASGNSVFVGTLAGSVYALDANNGSAVWKFHTVGSFSSAVLLVEERNALYVANRFGKIHAIDITTGSEIWQTDLGFPVLQSPAYGNGRIYIGAEDMKMYALDASDGSILWHTSQLYGRSFHDYSPVYAEDKVVVNVMPDTYAFSKNDLDLMKEACVAVSSSQDLSLAQDATLEWLQRNPQSQTMYAFDAATGQQPYTPRVLYTVVNSGAQPPPVYAQRSLYTAFHYYVPMWLRWDSTWVNLVGTGQDHSALGRMDPTTGKVVEQIGNVTNNRPQAPGEFTTDETNNYVGAGDILIGARCQTRPACINYADPSSPCRINQTTLYPFTSDLCLPGSPPIYAHNHILYHAYNVLVAYEGQ